MGEHSGEAGLQNGKLLQASVSLLYLFLGLLALCDVAEIPHLTVIVSIIYILEQRATLRYPLPL